MAKRAGQVGFGSGQSGCGLNGSSQTGLTHFSYVCFSVGKGFEDVRVGVEDLDAVDGGLGFEEVGHLGVWWEVVGDGAIVDTDGVSGGGVA